MAYQPPYTVTSDIIHLLTAISEQLGKLAVYQQQKSLRLRRINRIRTIQGSLAIEGNTLDEAQITAILEGKPVIAPPREIQEARNAIKAYESLKSWNAQNEPDLLAAHQLMMTGLVDDAGQYRQKGVGVMQGQQVMHMAPPANRVPVLMQDLLNWLRQSDEHLLIRSSVFHYEFEFIHPFSDGNGRMGRLWQTLLLSQWKPVFADLPIESMVYAHQADYYRAIEASTAASDAAPFIHFILERIHEACQLADAQAGVTATPQDSPQVTPQASLQIIALLDVMDADSAFSRDELQQQLGLKDRKSFRQRYLNPALKAGWIAMTLPDKPNSRLQQYRMTPAGLIVKKGNKEAGRG